MKMWKDVQLWIDLTALVRGRVMVAGRAVLDSGWVISPLRLEVTPRHLCIAQQ